MKKRVKTVSSYARRLSGSWLQYVLHETWKSALLFNTCWVSICCTHFLHDLQAQIAASSSFLLPPLRFAVFIIAPASQWRAVSPLVRLCSTAQCYFQQGWRTQKRHHLVTRCLFQMALQGDPVCTVVAFGIALANTCPRLIHTQKDKEKKWRWSVLQRAMGLLNLCRTLVLCVDIRSIIGVLPCDFMLETAP